MSVVAVTMVIAAGLAACDGGWDPDAQFAPSLRPVVGARASGGELKVWLGSTCPQVERVSLHFLDEDDSEIATLTWKARSGGSDLERLGTKAEVPGFKVTDPLPKGFAWKDASTLRVSIEGPAAWGTRTDLTTVAQESTDHPQDTYYFDEVGWLDRAAVSAGDGRDFLTPCTPDPDKD